VALISILPPDSLAQFYSLKLQRSSEALQKRLFTSNPDEQRAILQELQTRTQRRPVGLLSGAAATGTATGILGD